LAIVFLSGVVFILLSVFRVREAILSGISRSMAKAIACGIGLFIAFIGLKNSGVIAANPGTLVSLNRAIAGPDLLVFTTGLLLISVLHSRRVPGAILLGILASTVLSLGLQRVKPAGILGLPTIEQSAFLQLDFREVFSLHVVPFVIIFLFMDMFDTVGTLVGIAEEAGFMKDGKMPRASRAFMADAIGTTVGACLGTSTVTSYIESAAGVEQGGRTGLTALTVSILFLLALMFAPLISLVAEYPPITAPALVIVGAMMMKNAAEIKWSDGSEAIPSFLVMVGIPLCYSIADGLALGFVAYPAVKVLAGRGQEVRWPMYILAAVLVCYFVTLRFN
jgi:AGZA family xanthine/uracil permease-like MFS transporter